MQFQVSCCPLQTPTSFAQTPTSHVQAPTKPALKLSSAFPESTSDFPGCNTAVFTQDFRKTNVGWPKRFEVCTPGENKDCWRASIYPRDPPVKEEFDRWNAFYQTLSDRRWKKVKHVQCLSPDSFRPDAFNQVPDADRKQLQRYLAWPTPGLEIWFEKAWPAESETKMTFEQALIEAARIPDEKEAENQANHIFTRWRAMMDGLSGKKFGFAPLDFSYEEIGLPRYLATIQDKPEANTSGYEMRTLYERERGKYICDLRNPPSTSPSFPAKAKEAMREEMELYGIPPDVKARWFPSRSIPDQGSVLYWKDSKGPWLEARYFYAPPNERRIPFQFVNMFETRLSLV